MKKGQVHSVCCPFSDIWGETMKQTTKRRYRPKRRKPNKAGRRWFGLGKAARRRRGEGQLGYVRPKKKLRPKWEYLPIIGRWVFEIAIVCLFAYVAVWYFGQRVSTVGDSMSPILRNGDVVLVNRIVYNATTPKRGDIIVFKPKGERKRSLLYQADRRPAGRDDRDH